LLSESGYAVFYAVLESISKGQNLKVWSCIKEIYRSTCSRPPQPINPALRTGRPGPDRAWQGKAADFFDVREQPDSNVGTTKPKALQWLIY